MRSDLLRAAVLSLLSTLAACEAERVVHPAFSDGMFSGAVPLGDAAAARLRGNFQLDAPGWGFGTAVSVSSAPGTVSVFATTNGGYAVMKAGCLEAGSRLVLEGHWRHAVSPRTGLVRLFVEPEAAAKALCTGGVPGDEVSLTGTFGDGWAQPWSRISLGSKAPLVEPGDRFLVVAHRGGCRTEEDCGASENSVEVVRMAQSLGAEAIEIDVQLTADGVPLVFHDPAFSTRLTEGPYCRGPIREFTLAHVRQLCRLEFGEEVPTLDDVLRTAVEQTGLKAVWLDVKDPVALASTIDLLHRYEARAKELGRDDFRMILGLFSDEMVDAYLALVEADAGRQVSCLVELDPSDLRSTRCEIWAPRWTRGPMAQKVSNVQARGRKVAFWTVDEQEFVDLLLAQARPDIMLTNRPGLVFHRYQALQQAGEPIP